MNIMELGALGELVGAIAVVATLFYLAVQVRQGKKATEANTLSLERNIRLSEAAAFDEHDRRINDAVALVIRNETFAQILVKARQQEELTLVEAYRLRFFVSMWLRNNQSSYQRAKATGQERLMKYMTELIGQIIVEGPPQYREIWEGETKPRGLALDQVDYVEAVESSIALHDG